jgi:hypothetical protein
MAIVTHFDATSGLVTLKVDGEVDGPMIKEALQHVVDDPDFRRGADMLWDFTNARSHDPTAGGVQDLAMFVVSLKEKRGAGYRVALVASRDLEYGIARMYQAYAEQIPATLKVFRSLEEARLWLASSPPERERRT